MSEFLAGAFQSICASFLSPLPTYVLFANFSPLAHPRIRGHLCPKFLLEVISEATICNKHLPHNERESGGYKISRFCTSIGENCPLEAAEQDLLSKGLMPTLKNPEKFSKQSPFFPQQTRKNDIGRKLCEKVHFKKTSSRREVFFSAFALCWIKDTYVNSVGGSGEIYAFCVPSICATSAFSWYK